ncbi:tryptophan 7-halogenase [Streptomyces sp. LX-29]|uniref:NAD(P)/FAD-dependent oxidoreductase n=1 Tax=Streptomyces sp. LX-29 TaxID=2900152 RepID=UPI00240D1331|nr:tryptophan 7-halogenase [Streptomyces sp. LX-29]WFB09343.1 tryptophan 7-halogenase [Streptomyces sp. LX-29]
MSTEEIKAHYDVVIMGGGPGGSTLGALLARDSDLSVAIIEKEEFPREHIGESFAHPLIPVLEESGALPKVLASDCWVQKYGGIFNWDPSGPSVALFDHANWAVDGIYRWAMHVNRSEFDKILLDHAKDTGVEVFEGVSVSSCTPREGGCDVLLKDGRQISAGYFVDASGRRNSIVAKKKRQWLSGYRNIAIWQHYTGGRFAQTLPGDWNVFREENLSPIGCFAFQDGWCWYIPVPKIIDGERKLTHSIGMVTLPEILKEPGKDFTDPEIFLRTVQQVPMLKDLIQDVTPVMSDRMLTATNYSMINDRFADFDERWVLLGDASYFVDPLFSSGVAFAAAQASATAALLRHTAESSLPEEDKRGLWRDYDTEWHGMAETFALSIDQWYHAIGKSHPDSVYWSSRGGADEAAANREQTFQALLNTAFTPDLLQVLSKGSRKVDDLEHEGPYMRAYGLAAAAEPDKEALISLAAGVEMRSSVGLDVPGFKAFIPPEPLEFPEEAKSAIATYWKDPVANGHLVSSPLAEPIACHRFFFTADPERVQIRSVEGRDGGAELWELLGEGPKPWRELTALLTDAQQRLARRLLRAGMLEAREAD